MLLIGAAVVWLICAAVICCLLS